MKRQLAILFLCVCGPVSAAEQTISVPGEGWHLRFDGPALTQGEGVAKSIYYGRADRVQVSLFVEPPRCPGGDSDENIYECYAATLKKNPFVIWETERANTRPTGGVMVMYMSRMEANGVQGRAFNINLLFARGGKWVDLHTSVAAPTQEDIKALFALVNSAVVEDDAQNEGVGKCMQAGPTC